MKVVITNASKHLYSKLKEFDLEKDPIKSLDIESGKVYLRSESISVVICQQWMYADKSIEQIDARWDFVKKLLCTADDQPIKLEFSKNRVSLTFDY